MSTINDNFDANLGTIFGAGGAATTDPTFNAAFDISFLSNTERNDLSDALDALNTGTGLTYESFVEGTPGADDFVGGAKDDFMILDNPNDQIGSGGSGVDTVYTPFDATDLPDDIEAVILGGTGDTDITTHGKTDNVFSGNDGGNEVLAAGGNDVVIAGGGDDAVKGGSGSDTLDGGTGGDMLAGGTGNDNLVGGSGDDTLYGGVGDDDLRGGADNDQIFGGAGNDTLIGGAGDDTMAGGSGNDVYNLAAGGTGKDQIDTFNVNKDQLKIRDADASGTVNAADFTSIDTDPVTGFARITFADGSQVVLTEVDADSITIGSSFFTI